MLFIEIMTLSYRQQTFKLNMKRTEIPDLHLNYSIAQTKDLVPDVRHIPVKSETRNS